MCKHLVLQPISHQMKGRIFYLLPWFLWIMRASSDSNSPHFKVLFGYAICRFILAGKRVKERQLGELEIHVTPILRNNIQLMGWTELITPASTCRKLFLILPVANIMMNIWLRDRFCISKKCRAFLEKKPEFAPKYRHVCGHLTVLQLRTLVRPFAICMGEPIFLFYKFIYGANSNR